MRNIVTVPKLKNLRRYIKEAEFEQNYLSVDVEQLIENSFLEYSQKQSPSSSNCQNIAFSEQQCSTISTRRDFERDESDKITEGSDAENDFKELSTFENLFVGDFLTKALSRRTIRDGDGFRAKTIVQDVIELRIKSDIIKCVTAAFAF